MKNPSQKKKFTDRNVYVQVVHIIVELKLWLLMSMVLQKAIKICLNMTAKIYKVQRCDVKR